jgi:hypothetical protein
VADDDAAAADTDVIGLLPLRTLVCDNVHEKYRWSQPVPAEVTALCPMLLQLLTADNYVIPLLLLLLLQKTDVL